MGEIRFVSHIVYNIEKLSQDIDKNLIEIECYLDSLIMPIRNLPEISNDIMNIILLCEHFLGNV